MRKYDELRVAYENSGAIPLAENISVEEFYGEGTYSLTLHRCPWCQGVFMIDGVNFVHCPYCCKPVSLDWREKENE